MVYEITRLQVFRRHNSVAAAAELVLCHILRLLGLLALGRTSLGPLVAVVLAVGLLLAWTNGLGLGALEGDSETAVLLALASSGPEFAFGVVELVES